MLINVAALALFQHVFCSIYTQGSRFSFFFYYFLNLLYLLCCVSLCVFVVCVMHTQAHTHKHMQPSFHTI